MLDYSYFFCHVRTKYIDSAKNFTPKKIHHDWFFFLIKLKTCNFHVNVNLQLTLSQYTLIIKIFPLLIYNQYYVKSKCLIIQKYTCKIFSNHLQFISASFQIKGLNNKKHWLKKKYIHINASFISPFFIYNFKFVVNTVSIVRPSTLTNKLEQRIVLRCRQSDVWIWIFFFY